jgi:hypothetical protein
MRPEKILERWNAACQFLQIDELGTAAHGGRSLDRTRCAGYLVPSFAASSQDGHVRDSSGTSYG